MIRSGEEVANRNQMGRSLSRSLLVLVLLSGVPHSAAALDPSKPIAEYVRTSWTAVDGLPQNSVLAINQTQDGYLWLGTLEGLVRYNGSRFTVFNQTNTPNLKHSAVTSLAEAGGALWAGTFNGGLIRYAAGQLHIYTTQDGLPVNSVLALVVDRQDTLWIGTDHGLATYSGGKFARYTGNPKLAEEGIQALKMAPDGALWAATSTTLFRIDPKREARSQFAKQIIAPSSLAFDLNAKLWIGTRNHGVFTYSDDRLVHIKPRITGPDAVLAIYPDKDGNVWLGFSRGGLCRIRQQETECLTQKDGLSSNTITSIYADREGSLWVGTLTAGLTRLKNNKFVTYDQSKGML